MTHGVSRLPKFPVSPAGVEFDVIKMLVVGALIAIFGLESFSTLAMVSLVVSTDSDYRRSLQATSHRSNAMGLIVLLVVLILLFGGGGFYYGPPYHYYGGGLGLLLLIVVVVLLFRGRA
jgi:hypothetical protein